MSLLNFYVLTDTHFVSKRIWTEGSAINRREKGDQIAIKYTPEILDSFFDIILADTETSHVLITGDLINNGDKISHEDFVKKLNILTSAGKKVYVTAATHDYNGMGKDENFFGACRYTENSTEPIEAVYKTDLPVIYRDYGISSADSVDIESGSYSVIMEPGFRLIAINDNGNGRSHCGLFDEGFTWLTDEIHKAKQNNEIVFLAVHHPVIPPWPVYKAVADFELFGGYERLYDIMCRENVRLIFTGHTHVQGIKKYTDKSGSFFYDVTTIALAAANAKMRKVTINSETRECSIRSVGIDKIKGVDTGSRNANEYLYELNFIGLIQKSLPLASTDFEQFCSLTDGVLPVDKMKAHPFISKCAVNTVNRLKFSTVARFSKKYSGISNDTIKSYKTTLAKDKLFEVTKHIFTGNGPFNPQTDEYKIFMGAAKRADRLMKAVGKGIEKKLSGINSLDELLEPFLYNNRTGDDDNITIVL